VLRKYEKLLVKGIGSEEEEIREITLPKNQKLLKGQKKRNNK
jgi:hypothetical protein